MLKQQLQNDMKAAMKAGEKRRLGVIRLILAAVKQREVDGRAELNDEQILAVLGKMVKQRQDAIVQFQEAGRTELAEQESYEIDICKAYLPEAMDESKVALLVDQAISETGAASMKDMGKVMGWLKPKIQGRADMGAVSAQVRQKLNR